MCKMYGLFYYSYDYYEWQELEAVSPDIEKLKDYHKKEIDHESYHLVNESDIRIYKDLEKCHYRIQEVKII
jgi:hypothetical protein